MTKLVIDASVAVKWFRQEGETLIEKAESLKQDLLDHRFEVIVPDLFIYEVMNALLVGKRISVAMVRKHLNEISMLDFEIIAGDYQIINHSLAIAHRYSITVYDAVYVALTQLHNALLITANPKHHGKIKDGTVINLKDYLVE